MQEAKLSIAAIVCTLDRGPAIERTLAALCAQDLPADEFEILIIDNCSREENAQLLRGAVRTEPPILRYFREDKLGESSARNRALRECKAEILAFIDDDAIPDPNWLRAIRRAFAEQPALGAIGGRVLLDLEIERPVWLDDELLPYLSGFDLGEEQRSLVYPDFPRGANMAFRRQVFADGAKFDERLGLRGSCLLTMSETEMCDRVAGAGWDLAYLPEARVVHMISANRMQREWFADRVYWQGRSRCSFEALRYGRMHILRRIPGQVWGCLHKPGLQRRLHLGYLAECWHALLRDRSPMLCAQARESGSSPDRSLR